VSVGEIHLLRTVVAGFRVRHPDWEIIVSSTTDTGFDEAKKWFPDVCVIRWPLDFSWAVVRELRSVQPRLVVLAESELWPNFLAAANRLQIPVAVINGRMSPRSQRNWKRFGWIAGRLFHKVDYFAMQTAEHAESLCALGVATGRLTVTGSVKYDGVCCVRNNTKTAALREALGINPQDLVWVAGSTQAPEEAVALDIFRKIRAEFPCFRLIIVPRQKERFDEVAELLRREKTEFVRRSELAAGRRGAPRPSSVVLVDTFGELGAIWGLADIAFVGGSLDGKRGGQNMIEPAAYGAAVLIGPHTWNFRDTVRRLLEANGALEVRDGTELEAAVRRLLADPAARERLGSAARELVLRQQGATARTLDVLDTLISARDNQRKAA
jgi:3-deoxy-D-manno-octulosonic-acid transferase